MYAVILAGGGGTRLWPLSRGRRPKPFLPLLAGGGDLLGATVARLSPLVEPADIHIVADASHVDLVRASVPAIPAANVIGEPSARNTAAAVALAAHAIARPADDVMLVLPADQAVEDEEAFRSALRAAAARAAGGDFVTLGIEPTWAATGYGYVLATGDPETHAGHDTFRVERFEEKPAPERAQELIASGTAAWNAGIFVWRRDRLLDGLARHAADISASIAEALGRAGDTDDPARAPDPAALAERYGTIRSISIDYALLEPSSLEGAVAVVPAAVGWSDLGSWSALRELRVGRGPVDAEARRAGGEAGGAEVIEVGGRGVFVHATGGRTIAVVGLEDVIVVDTPDALLVCAADAAEQVKAVVDRLRSDGRDDLL